MSERKSPTECKKTYQAGLAKRLDRLDQQIGDLKDVLLAALTHGRFQSPQHQDQAVERR